MRRCSRVCFFFWLARIVKGELKNTVVCLGVFRIKKIVLLLLLVFSGCSHDLISEKSRTLADRNITFSALSENTAAFRGKFVLLGGAIVAVRREKESVQLLVSEYPLNNWGRPDDSAPSGGFFLATTSRYPDPDTYAAGALISLFGEVMGSETQLLKGVAHLCPVVSIREIHTIAEPVWRYYGIGGL